MVAVGVRTHILTTQPSEHKSNALNGSAMELQMKGGDAQVQIKGLKKVAGHTKW